MKKISTILPVLIVVLFSCTTHNVETQNTEKEKNTFPFPEKVILADLSDSLQPKTIALADMPKPITAVIPKKGKVPFVYTTPDGEVHHETLEPPVTKFLPVLKNENGETVKDKNGNPFILGEGGVSHFTNYSAGDGLAVDAILCITVDKKGYLWFGTRDGGVTRYDGNSFTTFTTAHGLANNAVYCIYAEKNGNIWFGTDGGGVSCFDGKTFKTFTTEQGLADNRVFNIQEDKEGNIWFLGGRISKGISRFDGTKFYSYTYDIGNFGNFIDFFEDQDKKIRFLFTKCIARFDGNSVTKISDIKGLPNVRFTTVTKDQYGHFWINTYDGIYRYASIKDLAAGKYVHYTTEQGLASNYVFGSLADKYGNLWFGTFEGISKYEYETDTTEGRFTTFTTHQGLAVNSWSAITEDKARNLWFGSNGGGVSRYNGKGITNFSTAQGLGRDVVRSITEDNYGNLWFGTFGGGATKYDGKSFTTYSSDQGLSTNQVKCSYLDDEGNVWLGGQGGLSRYETSSNNQTETITTYTISGLYNEAFWSIRQDNQGSLWFAMQGGGACRLNKQGFTFFSTDQGLASDDVRSIAFDINNNVWFGTFGNGLSYFDGTGFTSFNTEQGLSHNFVLCLATDKAGNLWIGTQDGLSFLSKNKIKKLFISGSASDVDSDLFKNFTVADGLPDNYIAQVVELPNGKMAVGTNKGVVFFDKPSEDADEFNALTGIEIYNTSTGYPIKNISPGQNEMFLDSKEILWVGTRSNQTALVRLDYKDIRKKEEPLDARLKRISINENDISWNDLKPELNALPEGDSLSFPPNITEEITTFGRELSEAERQEMRKKYNGISFDDITPFDRVPVNLVLPYKHNNISISYASNELAKPNLVQYQYILKGYDEEWSPVLKNTSATFGNIREGKYTFKVKARYTGLAENGADGWSEPVSYTFRVLPPWYRSWLAYVIYSLIFVFTIWQIHLFQKARTLRFEREKAQKRELEHAKEIEKAYQNLEVAHENLKATQSQLIQSEKMASLGELTAGIAHEIQNPLNFVNNFSEVNSEMIDELNAELDKGEIGEAKAISKDIKENELKINHHGKRAESIVKGMLLHSRSNSGQKEPTDINALCDEYLRLSYHGFRAKDKSFNADFKTEFDETLPKIDIIPQDIGRVLLNLINNAFYVVNEKAKQNIEGYKPEVVVSTSSSPFEEAGNRGVKITVKDNGPGIPESIKDKIFQPFFTTKPTGLGTGLGLSLSYDIVKAHGGELKVETNSENGTIFLITLPTKK